jgi:short-subunit dehydrogenase
VEGPEKYTWRLRTPRQQLSEQRILITGAAGGIGRALASELAARGPTLALAGRREEPLAATARDLAAAGAPEPACLTADLSVQGAAADLATRALAALGRVDILVNNAAVGIAASQWVAGDRDEARSLFETNLWSPLALVAQLVPGMRERGSGTVVNVSSAGQFTPFPMLGHYSASKAALAAATETLRNELSGTGVHVLHVVPGPTETAMHAEGLTITGAARALGRMPPAHPDELARLVVRAIERRRPNVVHPRTMRIPWLLPSMGRGYARKHGVDIDTDDPGLVRGGSRGDDSVRAAREAWEHARR